MWKFGRNLPLATFGSERVKEIKGSNPVQAWVFTGFLFKTEKKKAMILFSLIGDKTKTEEGFACRQYCFGLLGLISAVLMLGWRLSYKATPNDPKKLMWYHLSHSRVLQLAN